MKVTYAYLKNRRVLKGRLRKSSVLLPPFPEGLLWLSPFLSIHVYITFSPVVANLLNFLWTYEFILFFTYIPVHLSNAINIFSSAQIICYFLKNTPLAPVGLLGLWIWYMGVLWFLFFWFSLSVSHCLSVSFPGSFVAFFCGLFPKKRNMRYRFCVYMSEKTCILPSDLNIRLKLFSQRIWRHCSILSSL